MKFSDFPKMWGAHGIEVCKPNEISSALNEARELVNKTKKSVVVNIWVDPNEYAPGTKAQTMYK